MGWLFSANIKYVFEWIWRKTQYVHGRLQVRVKHVEVHFTFNWLFIRPGQLISAMFTGYGGRIKDIWAVPWFQTNKYKDAHHTAVFSHHPGSSTISSKKKMLKKGRKKKPWKESWIPADGRTGQFSSLWFQYLLKVCQLLHKSIHLLSWLHRKRKQGTLFSYPSLSDTFCLSEDALEQRGRLSVERQSPSELKKPK